MKSMIVAGVMSGTSADGVDVALCRITPAWNGSDAPRLKLFGHVAFPYSKTVRAAVIAAMDAKALSVAELSRLHWRLGATYADCVEEASVQLGVKPKLIGCHGQTIYHQSTAAKYLGQSVRATWQIGEAAVIAERLRIPVVSDLRPADLAANGQGAPLVPMLDHCMFRSSHINRVLQNLGGIGNLTAIPADANAGSIMAFDTGPGNMVIDACTQQLFNKAFDRDGAIAQRGHVLRPVLDRLLRDRYFSALPPKSCGREQFGIAYANHLIALCRRSGGNHADTIATATALTSKSICAAYRDFVGPHLHTTAPRAKVEYIVAGGGVNNAALMRSLHEGLEPQSVRVRRMEELGVPAQAKEAVAFALLAWLSWHRLPGNIPSATGADRRVVLGKISYA